MDTQAIAKRLVQLCREGKGTEAQDELYSADAESIEMPGAPLGGGKPIKGIEAIRAKGREFNADIEEVHGGTVGDPIVAGHWFSVVMTMDATFKSRGRVQMEEICVYQVRDGKVVREQFFYDVD
jgi:ketosteroid isomerase-like protein